MAGDHYDLEHCRTQRVHEERCLSEPSSCEPHDFVVAAVKLALL